MNKCYKSINKEKINSETYKYEKAKRRLSKNAWCLDEFGIGFGTLKVSMFLKNSAVVRLKTPNPAGCLEGFGWAERVLGKSTVRLLH